MRAQYPLRLEVYPRRTAGRSQFSRSGSIMIPYFQAASRWNRLAYLRWRARDVLMLIDERFAHNGASLVSISEGIDPTTPGGRLVITILAGLGEWERAAIIERTRAALDHLRANGRPTGPVLFGKKLDSQGQLVADPDAVRALRKARRLRRQGKSWREISAAMGWTISQCRTRLDASYREKTRAAAARRRGGTR